MGLHTACLRWLKQRTNFEKTLMSITVILLFTCVLLILIGFVRKENSDEETESSLCLSPQCYQTAGEVLGMKDSTVSPCSDFYDYACGKFVQTHSTPLDHHELSAEQSSSDSIRLQLKHWLEALTSSSKNISVFKKARTFYNTCMTFETQESNNKSLFLKIIKEQVNGEWPELDATWDIEKLSLERYLSALIAMDVSVAFKLEIVPDSSKADKYIAKISPGSPFLTQHQQDELRGDPSLRSYLVSALTLLGISERAVKSTVDNMLEIDHYFFSIKEKADNECGRIDKIRDDMSTRQVKFSELDSLMKTRVQWMPLLENLFPVIGNSTEFPVEVYCRHYIREYTEYLQSTLTDRTAYNYLSTRFFLTFMSHLGPSFHAVQRNYDVHHSSSKHIRPYQTRWKECVLLLEKYMLPVMATAYAQELSAEVQREGKRLSQSIKNSFLKILPSLSWIEDSKREQIKQKIAKVDFEIAFMKYSQNIEQVDHMFSELHLSEDDFIHNIIRLQKFTVTSRLKKLVSPDRPDVEWKNVTLTTTDQNQYQEGILSINFNKLVPPIFRLAQPNSLNYGKFGFFISRELIRYAFISGGISENLKSCLSKQYSAYSLEGTGKKVNGFETLHENLIDNIAQLTAYEAYNEEHKRNSGDQKLPGLHLSDYQNFFLSFAQAFCEVRDTEGYIEYVNSTFSPAKVRVNGALKNFHKFSEAYSCTIGTPMNPSKKCKFS